MFHLRDEACRLQKMPIRQRRAFAPSWLRCVSSPVPNPRLLGPSIAISPKVFLSCHALTSIGCSKMGQPSFLTNFGMPLFLFFWGSGRCESQLLIQYTGIPHPTLNNSHAKFGVALTTSSTSFRRARSGCTRKIWMTKSRSPRSESTVVSYASWQASGNSGQLKCRAIWKENLRRASDLRPAMPYLQKKG